MLEACPPGSRLCRASGQAFCIEHEADNYHVVRCLNLGQEVRDLEGQRVPYTDPRIQRIIGGTPANPPHGNPTPNNAVPGTPADAGHTVGDVEEGSR